MTEDVTLDVTDNIAIVTLNRPEKNNSINDIIWTRLIEIAEKVTDDQDIRAMITRGSGGNFCAGGDIQGFQRGERTNMASKLGITFRAEEAIESIPVPTIAAIEGYALGGGVELAACHDFRFADADAQFGFPEINVGVFPGAGGTQRVPRLIGVPKTKELVFTGEMISAQEAKDIDLVERVVNENVLDVSKEFASKFVDKPPIAMGAAKRSLNEVWNGRDMREGLLFEAAASTMVFETEDRDEGMDAFLSNREPEWKGR